MLLDLVYYQEEEEEDQRVQHFQLSLSIYLYIYIRTHRIHTIAAASSGNAAVKKHKYTRWKVPSFSSYYFFLLSSV